MKTKPKVFYDINCLRSGSVLRHLATTTTPSTPNLGSQITNVISVGAQLQLIRPHSTASLPLFSLNTLSTQTYTNSHLQSEPGEKFLLGSHPSPPTPPLINRKWFIRAYSLKQGVISEL